MADLISRAAAIERMKSMAGCTTCDNYNYVRCRACSWDDAMDIVDELPAVDAAPVEWLRERKHWAAIDGDHWAENIISNLLDAWQKEQEAQDE